MPKRGKLQKQASAITKKEVDRYEENLSAQEAPEAEGARIHEKNEDGKRTQGLKEKTRQGQSPPLILIEEQGKAAIPISNPPVPDTDPTYGGFSVLRRKNKTTK